MTVYTIPVRFHGNADYLVIAGSEEEAEAKANELAENDDFGELSDISWEVKCITFVPRDNQYIVCLFVEGRIEYKVYADNQKTAMNEADQKAMDADCGEPLYDIEWEVKTPTCIGA